PDECYAFLMIDPTSDLADHLKERFLVEGSPVRLKVTATFAYSEAFDDEIIKERVSEWLRDAGFSDKKSKDEVEDYRIIKLIKEIKDYKHLEENIAQIALRYNLSESRLSHAFKENVGISLKGYLTIARLKYAYRLVMEGKSKTYASYEAGFSSPAHLAYICKKQMGISITDVLR
ncbi:MAG: helix-turn-helix transcriptional regulator, partial [Lachnospiraceae bacterium]|nr:helix-turn-helix transcriptional regulator [Lachnospiraceae bacterium]